MVASVALSKVVAKPGTPHEALHAHWRQVGRFSTVEQAEAALHRLESEGVHAVVSMIDGLCVLAEDDE